MTREEAMQWLRERFHEEHLKAEPEWVETMIELLMIRSSERNHVSHLQAS